MHRLLVAALLMALSGMPIAGLVCDVLLCGSPAPAPSSCHEHGRGDSADETIAGAERCAHPVTAAVFLPAPAGAVAPPVADGTVPAAPWDPGVAFAPLPSPADTPASAPLRAIHRPLRI